ncbi:hypothetical protein BJ944DRAFT_265760 [Cunninghamella echinulata]|nr:hypothetical protein BJ944DRAFT_265760 [Cunninghamella echinulata]
MSLLRTVSHRLIRPTIIYCTKRTFQQSSYKYIVPEITVLKKSPFGLKQHKYSLHTSSTLNNAYNASDLTESTYHRISDKTLNHMVDILEAIGDETDIEDFDLEYSQGVLTLKLGEHGTYVINKQPPNKQIWLSSPKSGPVRYDYDATQHKWFYHRDNHTMDELLNKELSEILGDIDVLEGFKE